MLFFIMNKDLKFKQKNNSKNKSNDKEKSNHQVKKK